MKCSKCQFENPAGMKFCGECGSPLGASKSEAPPPPPPSEASPPAPPTRSYTPPHLATQVLQPKSALEGERKQVTVLFCDLPRWPSGWGRRPCTSS